jgi:hypothetical protein
LGTTGLRGIAPHERELFAIGRKTGC